MSATSSGPVTREVTPHIARLVVIGLPSSGRCRSGGCWSRRSGRRIGGGASLLPSLTPTLANFAEAWASADFPLYFLNSLVICAGILVGAARHGVACRLRLRTPRLSGRGILFALFLVQLMLVPVVLLVPNLKTIAALGLYDTLPG